MTAVAPLGAPARAPLFRVELSRALRGRTMKLLAPLLLYSVVATTFLMQRPPAEMVASVAGWFGGEQVESKLLLFIWTDGAMNKLAVVFGTVLAGGIISDERRRGSWDVIASKPITAAHYFTVRVAAAAAAYGIVYLVATGLGALLFPFTLPTLDVGAFLAVSGVHFFAATFAVCFAGLMAVTFSRKLTAMLTSVGVLFTLVGFAFVGFYWPALTPVTYLNPFSHGVALLARIDALEASDVALRVAMLAAFNLGVIALGRRRVAAMEDQ